MALRWGSSRLQSLDKHDLALSVTTVTTDRGSWRSGAARQCAATAAPHPGHWDLWRWELACAAHVGGVWRGWTSRGSGEQGG